MSSGEVSDTGHGSGLPKPPSYKVLDLDSKPGSLGPNPCSLPSRPLLLYKDSPFFKKKKDPWYVHNQWICYCVVYMCIWKMIYQIWYPLKPLLATPTPGPSYQRRRGRITNLPSLGFHGAGRGKKDFRKFPIHFRSHTIKKKLKHCKCMQDLRCTFREEGEL